MDNELIDLIILMSIPYLSIIFVLLIALLYYKIKLLEKQLNEK